MSKINFKISSGLKNIIGKDLITDDFVAIFELVKNSFDAYAFKIDLYFDTDTIYIIDNGKGMSKEDILNKWLFVAYSAKADDTEDDNLDLGYRSNIRLNRKSFAGNKGVGRFSCDSLGEKLVLQSRCTTSGAVSQIDVNWGKFEIDQKEEFTSIEVDYSEVSDFDIPDYIKDVSLNSGTILKISKLRSENGWDRDKLIKLRPAIAKLVDPFGSRNDLDIYIHSPRDKEIDDDLVKLLSANSSSEDFESPYIELVNGKIKNSVFEKLGHKTTRIHVWIEQSQFIYTELIDRGQRVYKIREPNFYSELKDVDLNIELFYMNTVAKQNFTRLMGTEVKNFGNIFLFNNGFRVYPVGEPNDDSLGLNTRKAQGYARFLGTRELLGKIYIEGSKNKFKESTSRDQGLINTPAYQALKDFFLDKALKRLEAYVGGVSWPDKLDQESENIDRILTDQGKGRVVSVVAKLVAGKEIELLEYSKELIDIVSERSEGFESTISQLQGLVDKSGNEELQKNIDRALTRYNELKEAEEESRKTAELERTARLKAEAKAEEEESTRKLLEGKLETAETAYVEEKKRSLFLTALSSMDHDAVVNFHHQIGIYSSDIHHLIQLNIDRLNHKGEMSKHDILHLLENISLKNQQILAISRFATLANFRMESEEIEEDLVLFCEQYLNKISSLYTQIQVEWAASNSTWKAKFKPIEMSIVLDNLVHNSGKARASKILFKATNNEKNRLDIEITDDGNGFPTHLESIDRIFEIGVSTTDGSGLGLYHAKQIINEMGGSINADSAYSEGAKFKIRFAR